MSSAGARYSAGKISGHTPKYIGAQHCCMSIRNESSRCDYEKYCCACVRSSSHEPEGSTHRHVLRAAIHA